MQISQDVQDIIVAIIIACALVYVAIKAYKTLTTKNNMCADCPLKESCNKKKTRIDTKECKTK